MVVKALLVPCLLLLPLAAAAAEKGRARPSAPRPERTAKAERAEKPAPAAKSEPRPPRAAEPGTAGRAPRPRVYDFGGLEVEGKLKTPQLLYFRTRVKQELDSSTPEKRSFMKELEKSADEKGL